MLCRHTFPTILGDMTVITKDNRIAAAYLGKDENLKTEGRLKKHFGTEITDRTEETARKFEEIMQKYLAGQKVQFDLPYDLCGTPFQKSVYESLLNIPFGKTVSYREIAEKVNSRGCRAVGSAVGSNPVIIAVPCHRVVRSDGGLGGYSGSGGLDTKRKLLKIEGIL